MPVPCSPADEEALVLAGRLLHALPVAEAQRRQECTPA